jgi:hypothetical protein
MKPIRMLVFVSILFAILLGACGPAKTELGPTPTTPPTPTSTPDPYQGWNKVSASNIEMWFPDGWEGGDIQNDLDVVVENLKTLGPEFDQIVNVIEANPDLFVLWVFDTDLSGTGYLTNLNVVKAEVLSIITIDKYAEAVKGQLPSSMTITDQKKVKLNQYDAVRLEVTMEVSGILAREMVYVVKQGSTMYTITIATHEDEFEARLPVFEKIASSFSIQE